MLLPFTEGLLRTSKFDGEMAMFYDGHYSRQKMGSPQFMPPGETIVLRDAQGLILFGWLKQRYRDDGQQGICCSVFRNFSRRRSSEVIREAEGWAYERWGRSRLFTYVNPAKIRSPNPGYCFKMAGWKFVQRMPDGKHLLAKSL